VRNAFLELAKLEPARFLVIDATQNVNSISQQIISEVIKRLQA
jgi:thymidylate kinase